MSPTAFISLLLPAAQECKRRFGIPVSFTIADAALETGWGVHVKGNNLFGVKADASWDGPVLMIDTHEVIDGKKVPIIDKFRLYKTWGDSVIDHGKFLHDNHRYKACFRETSGEGWAHAVAAAGYATDQGYAAELIAVMHGRDLARLDQLDAPAATVLPTT